MDEPSRKQGSVHWDAKRSEIKEVILLNCWVYADNMLTSNTMKRIG